MKVDYCEEALDTAISLYVGLKASQSRDRLIGLRSALRQTNGPEIELNRFQSPSRAPKTPSSQSRERAK
jgi:hypothetical protein